MDTKTDISSIGGQTRPVTRGRALIRCAVRLTTGVGSLGKRHGENDEGKDSEGDGESHFRRGVRL
ncbi:uncharacterized protein STEHIDRAFT_124150 [Stereum hirsutum FP-91666 SS1]|uniref:uncharacterized protein n=1 Tax=Stereum hirsutum (strain FP-91666) TaxID=721885 RepID=UPI000444A0D4|nr:uncharacterized protein STEHIDRAFT_124150 [Stereum hirsutum FP-91666 SS1]EIM82809.1 hypothetical protein STEHIDRAFT_124150 [Stereum hirsutum FP-91666 SS1]